MDESTEKVIQAIEGSDYQWRTLPGLVQDSGLTRQEVEEVLARRDDLIMKSTTSDGSPIFTTPEHYRSKGTAWNKFVSGVAGRAR